MNGRAYRAILNDVLLPLEETVFADENEWCFQQDSAPTHKTKKMQNGCKSTAQISSKRVTGPPSAQTSIHWTTNCGRCWRNMFVPRGTKMSTR